MPAERKEEVLAAAAEVFKRYGYKRVTMGDIAEAARMSRPALYLVFTSKEELFAAVLAETSRSMLQEIRQGLEQRSSLQDKLTFAFEIWSVRVYMLVQQFPDAKDIYESSFQFAEAVTMKAFSEFHALLATIIGPLKAHQSKVGLSPEQLAHLLSGAVHGFKAVARDVKELRELIAGLITIVLASLDISETEATRVKKRRRQIKKRDAKLSLRIEGGSF